MIPADLPDPEGVRVRVSVHASSPVAGLEGRIVSRGLRRRFNVRVDGVRGVRTFAPEDLDLLEHPAPQQPPRP